MVERKNHSQKQRQRLRFQIQKPEVKRKMSESRIRLCYRGMNEDGKVPETD